MSNVHGRVMDLVNVMISFTETFYRVLAHLVFQNFQFCNFARCFVWA
jgi:hypothetical protein